MHESVTIKYVVDVMNSMLKVDPEATKRLLESRVSCNKKLAEHPTIQCASYRREGQYTVGLLGVLNGIFGIYEDGMGPIAVAYDVICSKSENHKVGDEQIIEDKCDICGSQLMLGDLVEFVETKKN